MEAEPTLVEELLIRMDPRQRGCFFTHSSTPQGFSIQAGLSPSAQMEVGKATTPEEIVAFAKEHPKHLILFLISYDYGMVQQGLTPRIEGTLGYLFAYESYLRVEKGEVKVVGQDFRFMNKLKNLLDQKPPKIRPAQLLLREGWSPPEYEPLFAKVLEYIRAGDFYQLNLTQELLGQYPESGVDLFLKLLLAGRPNYGAYLSLGDFEMLSLSPECFVETYGRKVLSRPIKGTLPISAEAQTKLLRSQKEEAELAMITDLLRNDLSISCRSGSVKVRHYRKTMRIRGVIHSYSEVEGHLKTGLHPLAALLAAFPGGSVTGCPKRRAMEAIDEIEARSRGFYTGTFGYLDPHGGMKSSILIRTLFKRGEEVSLSVGGGLTCLSQMEDEFAEMNHKRNSVIGGMEG